MVEARWEAGCGQKCLFSKAGKGTPLPDPVGIPSAHLPDDAFSAPDQDLRRMNRFSPAGGAQRRIAANLPCGLTASERG